MRQLHGRSSAYSVFTASRAFFRRPQIRPQIVNQLGLIELLLAEPGLGASSTGLLLVVGMVAQQHDGRGSQVRLGLQTAYHLQTRLSIAVENAVYQHQVEAPRAELFQGLVSVTCVNHFGLEMFAQHAGQAAVIVAAIANRKYGFGHESQWYSRQIKDSGFEQAKPDPRCVSVGEITRTRRLCALDPADEFSYPPPPMSGKISIALAQLVFLAQFAAASGPPGSTIQIASPSVLLLRNGQVIEGHIERNGDYYTVTAPSEEIQIHAADVEFLCRDLHDGYQRKKAAIQVGDIQQHLQLLLWCERHDLMDCARQELDAVEAIDRRHPMIAVLRRRLKIESQPASASCRPAEKIEPPPSDEQLDHITRGMPPGTVELFVQVVQPILLNHYPGARGYSLPDNKRLQLMRPALGETPGRRLTQRNLYAVLQCIDFNSPGESPMLNASGGSSGGMAGEFPTHYSTQYQKLAQWVYLVAQKPIPAEEGGGGENVSFAELAGGDLAPVRNRPAPHIPYLPSSSGKATGSEGALPGSVGRGKDVKDNKDGNDRLDVAEDSTVAAGRHGKSKAASKESDNTHPPPRTQADRAAAQAIESVDPYDPATFNNQADGPTEMPTPAARSLGGK